MLEHVCVDDRMPSRIRGGQASEARFQLRLSALVWTRFEQKSFIPTLSANYAGRKSIFAAMLIRHAFKSLISRLTIRRLQFLAPAAWIYSGFMPSLTSNKGILWTHKHYGTNCLS